MKVKLWRTTLAAPVFLMSAVCFASHIAAAQTPSPQKNESLASSAQSLLSAPIGEPKSSGPLRDPDFGVVSRQFGLERTVEMYQWHRAGQGYFAGWSLQPMDSADFAPDHQNPKAFPIQSGEWRDLNVTLDGKPLAPDAVARFAVWRAFRPNFSALPGNLSATFQPEGDGLGSGENPLDPQIGDLRITWRELVLPPLTGKIELREGRWRSIAQPGDEAMPNVDLSQNDVENPPAKRHGFWLWIAGGVLLSIAIGIIAMRRRKKRTAIN